MFRSKYHLRHRKRALGALKNLESDQGKTDPKIIELCDAYARDVFGSVVYAPWLYVYSAVAGEFKEGWIPDNYYGKVVVPAIEGKYQHLAALKSLTTQLFPKDAFPDLGYFANGWFLGTDQTILTEGEMKDCLFENGDVVVFKLEGSGQGKGIFFFDQESFDAEKIRRLGNGVFQEYINQHPFFQEYMPSSVVTLRMTSVIDGQGKASVRGGLLRIGRNADTHVRSASNIRVAFDLTTGALDSLGYLPSWHAVDKHPDTGVAFAGCRIPNYEQCVSLVQQLHGCVPQVPCIGWDLAVDHHDNVRIMEWNSRHNGIRFSEARQGPCFSDMGWEKIWWMAT